MTVNYIIFTDLDGTLLDYHTYSFVEAIPALELIRQKKIPLIFVSSKTRKEIEYYQKETGFTNFPFIVENGAAIYTAPNYFDSFTEHEESGRYWRYRLGKNYSKIENILNEISNKYSYPIKGFHNSSDQEIKKLTSMDGELLKMSRTREFSIPVFYDKKAEKILKSEVTKYGLQIIYGGRFMHLISEVDKGMATDIVMRGYKNKFNDQNLISVALGDSMNDFSMLFKTDIPILLKKHDGTYESGSQLQNVIYSKDIGPKGWNRSIFDLLTIGELNE